MVLATFRYESRFEVGTRGTLTVTLQAKVGAALSAKWAILWAKLDPEGPRSSGSSLDPVRS